MPDSQLAGIEHMIVNVLSSVALLFMRAGVGVWFSSSRIFCLVSNTNTATKK